MQIEIAWLLYARFVLSWTDHVPAKISPSIPRGTTSHTYGYSSSVDIDIKDSSTMEATPFGFGYSRA